MYPLLQMAFRCAAALIGTQRLFSSGKCFLASSGVPLINIHTDIPNKYSRGSDRLPCFCRHVFLLSACWLDQCQLYRLSKLSSLLYSQWEYTLLTLRSVQPSKSPDEPDYQGTES